MTKIGDKAHDNALDGSEKVPLSPPGWATVQEIADLAPPPSTWYVDVTAAPYSADPTGTDDATTAIQAAIDAAGNQGAVLVPDGSYKVSDQGAGFCLDISALSGIHIFGPTSGRANPSATGGGATIFTTSASTKIIKAEAAALNHYGPFIENLRLERRVASGTCFSLARYNNYLFRNVTFRGFGQAGSDVGSGLAIDGISGGDASYGHIDGCGIQRNLVGMSMVHSSGCTIDGNCYFESNVTNHVLLDLQSGAAHVSIIGNKIEDVSDATGGVGIQVGDGAYAIDIEGNNFEGNKTMVNLVAHTGSTQYSGVRIALNSFTGHDASEAAVVIGALRQRDMVGLNRFSNVGSRVTDGGVDTIFFGNRSDVTGTGTELAEYLRVGGVYFGEGTAAPPAITVPDGSEYVRKSYVAYDRVGGVWVPRTGNLIGASSLGTVIGKEVKYNEDGTILGYAPIYDAITGVGLARKLGSANPGNQNNSNIQVTTAYAVSAGDVIVLGGGYGLGSTPSLTVTDSVGGNTWTVDRHDDDTSGNSAHSFVISSRLAVDLPAGTVLTLTFGSNVNYPILYAYHYVGMATSPVDSAVGATGTSTAPASGNLTTATDKELLFASVYWVVTATFTVGSGYTKLDETSNAAKAFAVEHRIAGTAGTYAAAATLSASKTWAISLVSYKAA